MNETIVICHGSMLIGEGVLPTVWKSANTIPLSKTKPLMSVKTDIRPISITPIAAKVFESIIMKYMWTILFVMPWIVSNLGV